MKKVSEYKDHADECRRLAVSVSNIEHREALLEMARTWDSLADQREEKLKREERLAALEERTAK